MVIIPALFFVTLQTASAARDFASLVNKHARGNYESNYAIMATSRYSQCEVTQTVGGFNFRIVTHAIPDTIDVRGTIRWADVQTVNLKDDQGENWWQAEFVLKQEIESEWRVTDGDKALPIEKHKFNRFRFGFPNEAHAQAAVDAARKCVSNVRL